MLMHVQASIVNNVKGELKADYLLLIKIIAFLLDLLEYYKQT